MVEISTVNTRGKSFYLSIFLCKQKNNGVAVQNQYTHGNNESDGQYLDDLDDLDDLDRIYWPY